MPRGCSKLVKFLQSRKKKMKQFKKAICNEIFEGWQIPEVFQYVAHLGYDGVEIAPHTLAERVEEIDSAQRRDIREAAESNKIEIVGLHLLLFSPRGLYLNHPDALIQTKTVDYLRALIAFCAEIGGKIVVFGSGKISKILDLNFSTGWYSSFISLATPSNRFSILSNLFFMSFKPKIPSKKPIFPNCLLLPTLSKEVFVVTNS